MRQIFEANAPVKSHALDGEVVSSDDQLVLCQPPVEAKVEIKVPDVCLRIPPRSISLLIIEDEGQLLLCNSTGVQAGAKNSGRLGGQFQKEIL